jgi:TatD DNase family protein
MLIDSHCHIDHWQESEWPDLIGRAHAAGVDEMVTIGTSLAQSLKMRDVAEKTENLWCTLGIHPLSSHEEPIPDPHELAALAQHPKVIGIGEAGLDFYYDRAPRDVQEACFRAQVRAARLAHVPICIHSRDADDDMMRILRDERDCGGRFDFLLHCFSSGRALALDAIDMGGYVSFSGILTFPKSQEIRDIARVLPIERLLVETDAPYLAPLPFRGKRNEPAWVVHTAAMLAQVKEVSAEEMAEITTHNFRRLYRKTNTA